ncbi:MAG: threonine ammonia-lyase IlvA [Lentilitoribacter sp.]
MVNFIKSVQMAERELRVLFPPTPLQKNEYLSKQYQADIYLKREDLSPVRSYKIRGAFNAMRKALAGEPDLKTFVCASAGNHAQGLAFACKHFGMRGVIFMPVTTPEQKINKTQIFGGGQVEIKLVGDYFDDTLQAAQDFCRREGARFLPPYDDHDVIEGQATVGAEIISQLEGHKPDVIVVPVGGGGLSAGLVRYMGQSDLDVAFRFTEPSGGRSLHSALQAGHLVTLTHVDNFVDGAAVARIGDKNFEILKDISADQVLGIDEKRLCSTIVEMLNIEGIVLEPAGALTVDALRDIKDEIKGKKVVCVTSGGNFDFERLPDVKERAMRYEGRKKYFILRLPQRPGALKVFLNLLGPDDDIARFEYLKKSARNFGAVLIGIETKNPDGFPSLFARLNDNGFSFQDITDNDMLSEILV